MTAYISLGSNLGDRRNNIQKALEMLGQTAGISFDRVSDIVETDPLGDPDQPKYVNAAAELKATLSAHGLFEIMCGIESALGRRRGQRTEDRRQKTEPRTQNSKLKTPLPRTIDLDLLLFGSEIVDLPDLKVPHPQMHLRSFVLDPLSQLNPNLAHPALKVSVCELAQRLNGRDFLLDANNPQLVSVAGNIGVGKTTLAKKISELLGCPLILEPYDTNPFMPAVYAGKKELALDSQLYFLLHRVDQLNKEVLAAGQPVVSDYVFNKELIYADRLLDRQQLSMYKKVYRHVAGQIVQPVLVIYLVDSPENCLKRIHGRNRPYEQAIELKFLEAIGNDYERMFANWQVCPVIRLATPQIDYGEPSCIQHLMDQLKYYIATANA